MLLKHWDERMDYEQSVTALKAIEELILETAPGIRERHHSFPFGDPHRMLDFSFDYQTISTGDAIVLRQVHALYSKLESLRIGVDKEQVAFEKFIEAELACKLTNVKFEEVRRGDNYFPSELVIPLFRAQAKIAHILGPVPKIAQLKLQLGPGATTNVKKQNASVTAKFSSPLACSGPLVPYLSEVLYELPHLVPFTKEEEVGIANVELHYGKLSFVPKNAKTYRSVVVEPILNTMCQGGIGKHITSRLSAFGIDIRDQTKNQRLAQAGSLTGALATLDLSSASDTISDGLVKFLLPTDWYCFLSRFLSRRIEYRGEIYDQNKFSSMGNGFTFPLETLIFFALADSISSGEAKKVTSVYGDDIIVDTERAGHVVRILEYCGFSVNLEKSFTEGPFRESCGADYLRGINIRPFYFKENLSCERIFSFHNYLYRSGYYELASKIKDLFLHDDVCLYGPDGFGDGHLLGEWTPRPHGRARGYCGYIFETYSHKPRLEFKTLPGDRVLPVYSIYVREDGELCRGSHKQLGHHLLRNASDLHALSSTLKWSPWDLVQFCFGTQDISVPLPSRDGRTLATLPGKARGYRRIKIYTLNT